MIDKTASASNASTTSASRRRAFTMILLVFGLVGIVAVLAGAEFATRYRERHRATVPGTMPLLFYRNGRTGHDLVRNADYFGWVHTNSQGFRGTREVSVAKTPGVFRIITLGSSTTFDQFVSPDDAAWPARLEVHLDSIAGTQVEVINAGVPGHLILDDLYRLLTQLSAYQPDLLVFYEGHNDLFSSLRRGAADSPETGDRPGEVKNMTPWGHWLANHSMLYAKLAGRVEAMNFRSTGKSALQSQAEDREKLAAATLDRTAGRFARDLGAFLATTQSLGLRVVVPQLVHVSGGGATSEAEQGIARLWTLAVPFSTPETVLKGYVRIDSVARVLSAKYGATYLPTAAFGLRGAQWYADDDPIHFNPKGAARMAEQMSRALLGVGLATGQAKSDTTAAAAKK